MAASSRVGAAQDALRSLLDARPGLDGITVWLGEPTGELEREQIIVPVEADEWTQVWDTTGDTVSSLREERFRLRIDIVVRRTDTDYIWARDRALALMAEVEACLRANYKLSDAVSGSELAEAQMFPATVDQSRYVTIRAQIACYAYLR